MGKAWDTLANQLVTATKSTPRGYRGRYLCSNEFCRQPVYYRKETEGKVRKDPTFVHYESAPHCYLYHQGALGEAQLAEAEVQYEPYRLEICIDQPGQKLSKWWLQVHLPAAPEEDGELIIEEPLFGPTTVSYEELKRNNGIMVPFKPRSKAFHFLIKGNLESSFAQKALLPVNGLKEGNEITVFSHKGDKGVRVSETEALYWGKSYCFVWSEESKISLPKALEVNNLTSNNFWNACEVKLPVNYNHELYAWLLSMTGHSVEPLQGRISLVFPSPTHILDDRTIVIGNCESILLAISDIKENAKTLSITSLHSKIQETKIEPGSPTFVKVHLRDNDHLEIALKDSKTSVLKLKTETSISNIFPSGPELFFENNGDSSITALPFYSKRTKRYLKQVQNRQCKLTKIKLPVGLQGKLTEVNSHYKRVIRHSLEYPPISRFSQETHLAYENSVLANFQEFLSPNHNDLIVDLNGYGSISLNSINSQAHLLQTLPLNIRSQIKWLVNQSQLGPNSVNYKPTRNTISFFYPHVEQLKQAIKSKEDIMLLSQLSSIAVLSPGLETHVRHLNHSLKDLLSKIEVKRV